MNNYFGKNTRLYKHTLKKDTPFIFLLLLLLLPSCSVTRFIPEDELLYTGATVEITSDTVIKNEAQLKSVLQESVRPEPNSTFLGMYPGLYYYYKTQRENPGFINRWLYKQIGEEPVYLSDVEPYQVEEILLNRLENRGFFYSTAASEIEENEKKKTASASYSLQVPSPYTMATYQLDTLSPPIYKEMQSNVRNSKFEPGMRFDLSSLKLERERIDNDLKKKGYYNFNPGFLIFEADTNQYDTKKFDLFLKLKKDVPKKALIPYRISQLNIYPNQDISKDSSETDVVRYNNKNYRQNKEFFKPKYLDDFITLEEGQLYDPETSKNTARRLSTIGAYKFVNIQYTVKDSSATDSLGILEANIYLSPLNKRAIRAELQAVTKSNNFAGPHLALTFSNRNLFRGGETLNISTNVGYEVQAGGGSSQLGRTSIDLGAKAELIFPRVISPFTIDTNFFEYSIPKTKTSIGLNYLSRSQLYTLLSANAFFGYDWNANRYVTHEINPISISYTKLSNTTPEFQEILEANPFLSRSFEQQFISGLTYAFTYNGMVDTQKTHQFYLNATFDTAGNSLGLLSGGNSEEPSTFLGLEFAQYAKLDADFRYHLKIGREQKIATRLFAGYGLPYGNSDVVPFVKQYYAGGPYSVRAFRIRSLGPGSYSGENDTGNIFDRTGNIRLEANIEYRFPLFSFVKGAVFADAGNIWLSEENEALPGGEFSGDFISELGIGTGVGIRVDVQGFVIRFDLAAPLHDPGEEEGERFDFKVTEPILNFAIGYPF